MKKICIYILACLVLFPLAGYSAGSSFSAPAKPGVQPKLTYVTQNPQTGELEFKNVKLIEEIVPVEVPKINEEAIRKRIEKELVDTISKVISQSDIKGFIEDSVARAIQAATKDLVIEKPVIKEVEKVVEIPKVKYETKVYEIPDIRLIPKEIIDPVLVKREVTNCVIEDVKVKNAVIEDVPVTNAVVKKEEYVIKVPKVEYEQKVIYEPVFREKLIYVEKVKIVN